MKDHFKTYFELNLDPFFCLFVLDPVDELPLFLYSCSQSIMNLNLEAAPLIGPGPRSLSAQMRGKGGRPVRREGHQEAVLKGVHPARGTDSAQSHERT